MQLGEFPAYCQRWVSQGIGDVGQRGPQAMRRLEQHDRLTQSGSLGQGCGPVGPTAGQEAEEDETVGGKTGHGQRRRHRRHSGNADHLVAGLRDGCHHAGSRVADGRRTRVSHEGNVAFRQRVQQARQLPLPIVLVAADQSRVCLHARQQASGDAGILCGHQRHRRQYPRRPEGDVLQVADGCADYVKGAHGDECSLYGTTSSAVRFLSR